MILYNYRHTVANSYYLAGEIYFEDDTISIGIQSFGIETIVYCGALYRSTVDCVYFGFDAYSIIRKCPSDFLFERDYLPYKEFTYKDLRDMVLNKTLWNTPHIEPMSAL